MGGPLLKKMLGNLVGMKIWSVAMAWSVALACGEISRSHEYKKGGDNSQFGITINWLSR